MKREGSSTDWDFSRSLFFPHGRVDVSEEQVRTGARGREKKSEQQITVFGQQDHMTFSLKQSQTGCTGRDRDVRYKKPLPIGGLGRRSPGKLWLLQVGGYMC